MSPRIDAFIEKLKHWIDVHKFMRMQINGFWYTDGVLYLNSKKAKISFFNLYARTVYVNLEPFLDDSCPAVDVDVYVNGKKQTSWHFEKGVSVEKNLPYWVFDKDQILLDRTLRLRPFWWNKIVFKIKGIDNLQASFRNLCLHYISDLPHKESKFKISYFKYILSKKKKRTIRRLFITTGNFSLINALCYIEETKSDSIKYEDNLLIFGAMTEGFSKTNLQIAQNYHFKKIIIVPIVDLKEECVKNKLSKIDEVISVWQGYTFPTIAKLYPKSKLTIILESIPLFKVSNMLPSKISLLYLNNYMGLLDYAYPNPEFPVWYLNKDIYKGLLTNIREKYSLYINVPKQDKYILFCAPCDLVRMKLPENNMLDMIYKLKEKGYKVLLKKHPRDTYDYTKTEIELLDTSFPVEFYDLSNILCVVGYQSNMLATLAEEIPTFCYIPKEIQSGINPTQDRATYMTKKYVMPIDKLLEIDANSCDFETLSKKLKSMQKDFLKNVGKISEDKEFQKKFSC